MGIRIHFSVQEIWQKFWVIEVGWFVFLRQSKLVRKKLWEMVILDDINLDCATIAEFWTDTFTSN